MGSLSGSLAPEEQLLLHRRPHLKTLFKPIGALILITAVAGGLIFAITLLTWGGDWILNIAVGVLWLVAVVWLFFAPLARWATTHFAITDRRILYRTGVFNKSGIDIPLVRINSVQFRHDFVDRLFKTGTLIIESASDEPLEFSDIPQVEKVHGMIYASLNDVLTDEK